MADGRPEVHASICSTAPSSVVSFKEDRDDSIIENYDNWGQFNGAGDPFDLEEEKISVGCQTDNELVSLEARHAAKQPEVVEDFIRNFLKRVNMNKTLNAFQHEWYELKYNGIIRPADLDFVPNGYVQMELLQDELVQVNRHRQQQQLACQKAQEECIKLRKERDYHRMHHKRLEQEKEKLTVEMQRLQKQCDAYEPSLKELQKRYESAMREKTELQMELNKVVEQVTGIQVTVHGAKPVGIGVPEKPVQVEPVARKSAETVTLTKQEAVPVQEIDFPSDVGANPYLHKDVKPGPKLDEKYVFKLKTTIEAHSMAVSGLVLHPAQEILASVSDDKQWRLWSLSTAKLIMSGQGHTDWIAGVDFNPQGSKLVTASGDTTVRIWDFVEEDCVLTFTEHSQPVWDCSWHYSGNFIASCSMDNTAKIWDLSSEKCRITLRGHVDSVNSITFLPYSNTVCTCSADKTITFWDPRTGLGIHTLHGHLHSINSVAVSLNGNTLASCDSYGVVKLWNLQSGTSLESIDFGPHPANSVAFDPSGNLLAVASGDGSIHLHFVGSNKVMQLVGHDDAVQDVVFDKKAGDYIISGAQDNTIRIWK